MLAVLVALLATASATETPEPDVRFAERTELIFDEVEVEGTVLAPRLRLLVEQRHAAFPPLVRLRTDFQDELRRSVDQIK